MESLVVGLTGGVASGKSLISAELKRLGACVVDADVIAREAVRKGEPAYEDIVRTFGKAILNEDGTLDRKTLGAIVFSDPEKLSKLNSITHPRIRERLEAEIEKRKKDCPGKLIVVDVALLIEGGLYKKMAKVILVKADEGKQAERLRKRDNLSTEEAKKRIKAQMPLEEKMKHADFIIDNNGEPEEAIEQARRLYERLCKTN